MICDRVRAINRLRATLLEYFPALKRSFDYSKSKAALTFLSSYSTPESLRRIGVTRLAAWLKARGCRNSSSVAQTAVETAHAQRTVLATQAVGSSLLARLAAEITRIDAELVLIDAELTDRFEQHRDPEVLVSLAGIRAGAGLNVPGADRRRHRRFRQRRSTRVR